MSPSQSSEIGKQALRRQRFLIASSTYALGLFILGMCSAVGLLPAERLGVIGAAFAAVNAIFYVLFRSGLNRRFGDPSLTRPQLYCAALLVAVILVLGERVQFLVVPFYSSLFIFAMLKLTARELLGFEAFILATYVAAVLVRVRLLSGAPDWPVESVNVAFVILSSIWFSFAAAYISNLRARLRDSVQTIEQLANRDGLTDAWNRRHIEALLGTEMQRQKRFGGALSACLADVDHFKSINDSYGHPAGDAVLRNVAAALRAQLRSVDQLGRFGGEEFLILLPGTGLAEALGCAERLRRGIGATRAAPGVEARVTISIGVAECRPGESLEDWLARIDRALYDAKRGGRDRVVACAAAAPAPF